MVSRRVKVEFRKHSPKALGLNYLFHFGKEASHDDRLRVYIILMGPCIHQVE